MLDACGHDVKTRYRMRHRDGQREREREDGAWKRDRNTGYRISEIYFYLVYFSLLLLDTRLFLLDKRSQGVVVWDLWNEGWLR